jgi:hypothetical protein
MLLGKRITIGIEATIRIMAMAIVLAITIRTDGTRTVAREVSTSQSTVRSTRHISTCQKYTEFSICHLQRGPALLV